MGHLFNHVLGIPHFIAAVVALITGTSILALKKGTKTHIRVGYVYVLSMLFVNGTAFMIYNLFDGWGIFHHAAVISMVSLTLGMVPILIRSPKMNWRYLHFSFMYWSIMGLYAAFAAEMLTRIPKTPFFGMVGVATASIMLVGGIAFGMKKKAWMKQFGAMK